MPSLALIFHLVDVADGIANGPVSLKAAETAVWWCQYLETHARRIYGLVADVGQQAAAQLSKKIAAGGLDDGFSVRDVYRKNWSLLNTKEVAKEACDELVEANWLREVVTPSVFLKKGKTTYLINPKAKSENA